MKVAFWNVNMGVTSFQARLNTFTTWCNEVQPDLLLLEEVSSTLQANALANGSGMTEIGRVGTLDVNRNPSTKDLVALEKTGTMFQFACTALRFPNLSQRRMLLKVTCTDLNPTLTLWGIHANASKKGGQNAVTKVATYLANNPGAVVGGDFNLDYNSVGYGYKRKSKRWDNFPTKFTQWNRNGNSIPPPRSLGIRTPIFHTINTGSCLDYVLYGSSRKVIPKKNCKQMGTWREILVYFDHCPIVFEIIT